LLSKRYDSAFGDPDRHCGTAVGEDEAKRQAMERRVVDGVARIAQMKRVEIAVGAVFWRGGVGDDDVLAAGAATP